MDRWSTKSKLDKSSDDNSSLGVLNMDNFKVFGETSANSSVVSHKNSNKSRSKEVNERLHEARLKANEMLNKSKQRDSFMKPANAENKENIKATCRTANSSPGLDHTDYVPFTRNNPNNVSDLVIDHSIPLELSAANSCPPSAAKNDVKISFVPAEFTGRSTCAASLQLSVGEILASSFAQKARNLCETLHHNADVTLDSIAGGDVGVRDTAPAVERNSITANSSSFSFNFNSSHSLPRTADMSRSKISCSELSYNACSAGGSGFSFGQQQSGVISDSAFNVQSEESFAPGELMQSQLLHDEILWAEQYAAIPSAALSEQAKAMVARASSATTKGFDSPLTSNSMIANDPNFSVGNFFNMRSENLWNIVSRSNSPQRLRSPVPLIDETVSTTHSASAGADLITALVTPKPDNRTYSIVGGGTANKKVEQQQQQQHESKDSGNGTEDNSYLLSISAIDRALSNLDVQSDDVVDRFMKQVKENKSTLGSDRQREEASTNIYGVQMTQPPPPPPAKTNTSTEEKNKDLYTSLVELISENKENINPQLADTISFTESLLNSSEMRQQDRSPRSEPRSPLSPLPITAAPQPELPKIKISMPKENNEEANNADIDEWPSSPVVLPSRRVRRNKSPVQKSLFSSDAKTTSSPEQATPINRRPSPAKNSATPTIRATKSLCSTRLDNATSTSVCSYDFGISPNLSNKSVTHIRSNDVTLTADAGKECPANTRSPGTARSPVTGRSPGMANVFDNSPMSSPLSFNGTASNGSSPCYAGRSFRSPRLDTTTNSERRFLNAVVVQKTNSSPGISESGTNSKYGLSAAARSCSTTSLRSNNARNISRCSSSQSNSSEFSHRDGKAIPLKVTALELCWGTTKLRTETHKSMQVKNNSAKRLNVRIEIHGPGFQIANAASSSTLTLQSQECRTITVNFCPTVLGAACGTLAFYAPHNSGSTTTVVTTTNGAANPHTPFLAVPLYGYGGHAYITLQQILKGPVGAPFLPMGDLCELASGNGDLPLERTFTVHNKGALMGFALVCIDSVGLTLPRRLCDAFAVQPHAMLIPPGGTVTVRIIFRPRRDDMKKIFKRMSQVLTLANLRITCGDESNRQRIRRLVERMSSEERAKIASSTLDKLWQPFPQEFEMDELSLFKEPPSTALDLLCGMRIHEVALTLNHERLDETAAETSSLYFNNADETVLFRTICCGGESPTTGLDPVEEEELFEGNTSLLSSADVGAVSSSTSEPAPTSANWSVTPKVLEINLNSSSPDICFFVRNSFKSRQYFEVVCNPRGWLRFTPNEGFIEPNAGQLEVKVHASVSAEQQQASNEQLKIMVYMENDRISIPVRIKRDY